MEHPDGSGARRADRADQTPGRALHPRYVSGADVRLRGHAHPPIPRSPGNGPRAPAVRDLRRVRRPRAAAAAEPEPDPERRRSLRDRSRGRRLLPGHFPQPDHPRGARALPQRPRQHQGAQVAHPRLRRLHLRPQLRRVQESHRGLAKGQHRDLLREQPGPRGDAPGHDRPVRPRPSRPGRRRRLQRDLRGDRGSGRPLCGQRRLHRPQHQRPVERLQAHRRRDADLLPRRLQPHEHGARRQVPQDPGEGPRPERGPGKGSQGLLRPLRPEDRSIRQARRRPRDPDCPRLALRGGRHPPAHDRLRR